jgi:hypothetical protein
MKIVLMAVAAMVAAPVLAQMPEQAQRGEASFFHTSKGTACGTCHSLQGKGTAVGPDLKRIARVPPKAFLIAIKSTMTQYVRQVELKNGTKFPGIEQEGKEAGWWDLSKMPPEFQKLTASDIGKAAPNATWKHPPAATDYSNQELADIIAYIKWVGYKSVATIEAEELE